MTPNTVTPLTPLHVAFKDGGNHVRAVIENDQVVGIALMRQVLEQTAAGHDIHTMAVRDIMQTDVISMVESSNRLHAARLFVEYKIKSLVITDIHGHFLRHINATEAMSAMPSSLLVFFQPVENIMVRKPLTTHANAALEDVIETWVLNPVSCLIACDEHHIPTGMLSESDVLKWIQADCPNRRVADYMQAPVVSLSKTMTIREVWGVMQEKNVTKMILTEGDGSLSGLVTATDILVALCRSQLETFAKYQCPDNIDMMLEWHKKGMIMAVSDHVTEPFGLERHEMVGLHWQDGLSPEVTQALLALGRNQSLDILWEIDGAALPFTATRDSEQSIMWWRLQ